MQVTVSGDAGYKRYALAYRHAAGPSFEREMDRALVEAGDDVTAGIRVGTDIYMPSGYEELFSNRLITKVELSRPQRKVSVVAWARGKTSRRDVKRHDKGELRHPVFGRERVLRANGRYIKKSANIIKGKYLNPWAVTAIRPGFYSNPVSNAPIAMQRRLKQAGEGITDKIGKAT